MNNRKYWTGTVIESLAPNEIFVFGSNPGGLHAGGAAYAAMKLGAIWGFGRGIKGQTYALVTKNLEDNFVEPSTGILYPFAGLRSVTLKQIADNVAELYEYAKAHPEQDFMITFQYETHPDGTPKASLSGYTSEEMFQALTKNQDFPDNVIFHDSYKERLA